VSAGRRWIAFLVLASIAAWMWLLQVENERLRRRSQVRAPGIELASGRMLDVGARWERELPRRLLERGGGRVHLLVRLSPGLEPAEIGALEAAGLFLLDHMEGDCYVASLRAGMDPERAPFAGRIWWCGELLPEDKLHRRLGQGGLRSWEISGDWRKRRVLVALHEDVEEEDAWALFGRLELSARLFAGWSVFAIEVEPERLRQIAEQDEVLAIEPGPEPIQPLMLSVRASVGTDQVHGFQLQGPTPTYQGLTGRGIRVGICDLGIDQDHPDFAKLAGDDPGCNPGQPARFYRSQPGDDDHGTHVASIVGGSGAGSFQLNGGMHAVGDWNLRGHAPRACLGEYPGLDFAFDAYWEAVVLEGTHLFNHSYALHAGPEYGLIDREIDRMVRGGDSWRRALPSRLHVFAAGNHGICNAWTPQPEHFAGYHSLTISAKNALVVGSIDVQGDLLSQFSSLGPTLDGRVKPELVAPGARWSHGASSPCWPSGEDQAGVLAAHSQAGGTYGYWAGTSMAAPVVTGIAALMMEALEGSSLGLSAGDLRASTWRALLVQTARDLESPAAPSPHTRPNPDLGSPTTYAWGVDHATGYGKVSAVAACALAGDPARWVEGVLAKTGEERWYCMQVPPGSRAVTVTLAWDDPPGSTLRPAGAPKLVNDLDLELHAPDGSVVMPWVVPPLPLGPDAVSLGVDAMTAADVSPAVRQRDPWNNLEQVRVTAPEPGIWRVRVRASFLAKGRTQPFSLAFSAPRQAFCLKIGGGSLGSFCERFPWFCRGPLVLPRFRLPEVAWEWPPGSVLPVHHLRAQAGLPQEAPGPAWVDLPGFEILAGELPAGSELLLLDEQGAIRASMGSTGARAIRVESQRPGEAFHLLLLSDAGEPLHDTRLITLRYTEIENR
jgi:hypothetical protein